MVKNSMTHSYTVGLIGCGKMGSALLSGWQKSGLIKNTHILEPNDLPSGIEGNHHRDAESFSAALPALDLIVLAVKPQVMKDVCTSLGALPKSLPVLSIAAGQTIQNFQNAFGADQPIIRAMPNTPAAIGKGMIAGVASQSVTTGQETMAEALMRAAGDFFWLSDESQMDALTAVSGSGPAYLFYFIEALAAAAENQGFDKDTAMRLARQTVVGAAALAESATEDAADLRKNVTSPGGTTEAALNVLMDGNFEAIMKKAVTVATARSKELSK